VRQVEIFALIILVTIAASVFGVLIGLAIWPGRTAKARAHPYADAVNVAGWVGILTGGLLWPLALIWAYATPARPEPAASASSDSMEDAEL